MVARSDVAARTDEHWIHRLARAPARRNAAASVLKPGRNVWRMSKAESVSFLVDAAAYFAALDHSLRQARQTIWIVGWDFNPDIRLKPRQSSETLGELLLSLVDENPQLDVRILIWGMGPVYSGKSLRLFRQSRLSAHPQVNLRFDLRHPLRACHHQKLVAIDDECAFLGGIDLTARRWDEPDHRANHLLRKTPDGESYGAVHDIQAMVRGNAARMIGDVARRRWEWATGQSVAASQTHTRGNTRDEAHASRSFTVDADLKDVTTAVALTEPGLVGRRGRHEAVRLTRDAIKAAKRHIYIETQYLASFSVGRALAARLKEPDGPEIVVIVTKNSHGFVEQLTMGNNRDRLIRKLKRIDHRNRLRVLYPTITDENGEESEILVHSKLIVVDDSFVRVGSSNLNHRSEGLDTECDLAIESGNDAHRAAIVALRDRLLAEHLDVSVEAVRDVVARSGSIIEAIDTLNLRPRGLRDFVLNTETGETTPMPGTALVDPRRPFRPLRELRLHAALIKTRVIGIFL